MGTTMYYYMENWPCAEESICRLTCQRRAQACRQQEKRESRQLLITAGPKQNPGSKAEFCVSGSIKALNNERTYPRGGPEPTPRVHNTQRALPQGGRPHNSDQTVFEPTKTRVLSSDNTIQILRKSKTNLVQSIKEPGAQKGNNPN